MSPTTLRASTRLIPVLVAALTLIGSGTAFALPVTFAVVNGTGGGEPQNGTAAFSVSGSTLTIVLTNTAGAGELDAIASVLDGLQFTVAGSPGTMTLSSVSAAGGEVCLDPVPTDCGAPTPANFGWLLGGSFTLAPNGLKPYGIINNNVQTADGIPNDPHNPYLMGPVTFSINFTGTITDVTAATLQFGTTPINHSGVSCPDCTINPTGFTAAPEPGSLILLGSGLLAASRARRRDGRRLLPTLWRNGKKPSA
jgi:PEP-CTERM motif